MLRFAAPFVGLAALLASPAFAQSAAPPADPNKTWSDVEAGSSWIGYGNANVSIANDCAQLNFKLKGLDAEAAAAERLSKGFEKLGDGLTLLTAGSQAAQGRYDDMTQTLGEAAFDKTVCAIWPGPVCVSWSAGRMAGSVIKMMPMPLDSQHRTIEEAVLDGEVQFAQWLMPSLNQPMNVANMREAFNAFQRQRTAVLNARDRLRDRANQCSNDHHGDEPDYADRDDGSARQSTQATSADRAMEMFRSNGGDPNQSWNNAANYSSGQSSAPTYSPAPVQQSQPSSSSGFDFGQALGAVLTGYAIGTAANQSSSSSKSSSTTTSAPTPEPADDSCWGENGVGVCQ